MNVIEDNKDVFFKKSELVRMPVRLGEDAFYGNHVIRTEKIEQLLHTILAFKHLMIVQNVVDYRACATSAMREAANSGYIVDYIYDRSGVKIEVIDGQQEAELVYANRIVELINNDRAYLYVDIGGGSTELTLFSGKKVIDSASFNIGTIRLLNREFLESEYLKMKIFLKGMAEKYSPLELIGSGGNINKVHKISGLKEGSSISYKRLNAIYKYIDSFSIDDRIKELGFNPDRADVILPATGIFLKIMKWTKAKKVLVPKIGVSDGIVHQLYNNYRKSNIK